MSEPKYVAETLRWCNWLRQADGKPPLKRLPKGRKFDSLECPCGKATGWHVYATAAHRPRPFGEIEVPRAVSRFVTAFDSGRLPQYEARP